MDVKSFFVCRKTNETSEPPPYTAATNISLVSQPTRPPRRHSSSSVHSVSEKKESVHTSTVRQQIEPVNPVGAIRKGRPVNVPSDDHRRRKHSVSSQSTVSASDTRGNSRSNSPNRKSVRLSSSSSDTVTGLKAALRSNSYARLVDGLPYTTTRRSIVKPKDIHPKAAPVVKPKQPVGKSDSTHAETVPPPRVKTGKVCMRGNCYDTL